jgi:hypothetical protein
MSVALFSFPVGRQKWAFLLDLINAKLLMSVTCSEEYRHIWGLNFNVTELFIELENGIKKTLAGIQPRFFMLVQKFTFLSLQSKSSHI